MSKPLIETVKKMVIAKTPLIYIESEEEERVERLVKMLAETTFSKPVNAYTWTCTKGVELNGKAVDSAKAPADAINWAINLKEVAFIIFEDLQWSINDPAVIRKLKEAYKGIRDTYKTIFIIATRLTIPDDLKNSIAAVELGLPLRDELETLFLSLVKMQKNIQEASVTPALKTKIVNAILGLTYNEADRAIKRALIGKTVIDDSVVTAALEEKYNLIKKSGVLEYVMNTIKVDEVGGMENLKSWLSKRANLFSKEARDFGLSKPKGVLMTGISGCGKSLFVKAIASFWGLPLIRLDMSRVYEGTFGSAEECLRKAINSAEAIAPCILWIDEIEAGISVQGFKAEGGSATRVLGTFLTWMQEKDSFVFVAATANAIHLLPAEILRKGRFDEIFYVTLPNKAERLQIFKIHLEKRKNNPHYFDIDLLAHSTKGFSGAEIEQIVSSAMYEAFSENREMKQHDIMTAINRTVPLSITMDEQIKEIENWAFNRAVRASEKKDD